MILNNFHFFSILDFFIYGIWQLTFGSGIIDISDGALQDGSAAWSMLPSSHLFLKYEYLLNLPPPLNPSFGPGGGRNMPVPPLSTPTIFDELIRSIEGGSETGTA